MPPITNQTITAGYDAGNRLRTLVDSINGTISRDYDNLDRGTKETTAHREWRLRSELQTAAPQHRLSQVGRD